MSKPTVSLAKLYADLEFLGGIGDKQKYSFVDRKYINTDWVAIIYRHYINESQDVNGILNMENICTDAVEQYNSYKNDRVFGPKLLDTIVKARHGLSKCATTYKTLQRLTTASNIEIKAIFLLDNIIPEHRKELEGITHKKQRSTSIEVHLESGKDNSDLQEISVNDK